MTGRIIGIRTVKTPGSDEPAMISGGTECATQGGKSIQRENGKGMVYLVVDCSASMAGYKIDQARKGILEFAEDAMRKDYMVGLITFASSATHLCELKDAVEDLRACLDKLEANGSTNMAAAIAMAHEHLGESGHGRVMVIATDGRPDRAQSALQAGQSAKSDGIEVVTIGTDDADSAFLQKLATSAELGNKVRIEEFGRAIASACLLLPAPGETARTDLSSNQLRGSLQYSRLPSAAVRAF